MSLKSLAKFYGSKWWGILTLPESMRSLYKGDDLTKDQKHITHPTESYNICLTSILLTSSGIGLKAPAKPIT